METKGLSGKVKQLRYVAALLVVTVDCVGVAGRGDGLEAESRNAYRVISIDGEWHSKSRSKEQFTHSLSDPTQDVLYCNINWNG